MQLSGSARFELAHNVRHYQTCDVSLNPGKQPRLRLNGCCPSQISSCWMACLSCCGLEYWAASRITCCTECLISAAFLTPRSPIFLSSGLASVVRCNWPFLSKRRRDCAPDTPNNDLTSPAMPLESGTSSDLKTKGAENL